MPGRRSNQACTPGAFSKNMDEIQRGAPGPKRGSTPAAVVAAGVRLAQLPAICCKLAGLARATRSTENAVDHFGREAQIVSRRRQALDRCAIDARRHLR